MRKLLLLLAACGPATMTPDASSDAGHDGGAVDAGHDAGSPCDGEDGGTRYLEFDWTGDFFGAACSYPMCSARLLFDNARICRMTRLYVDAGCSLGVNAIGDPLINCESLCDHIGGTVCCTSRPTGVARNGCSPDWMPP